jgi:hypothetical protein
MYILEVYPPLVAASAIAALGLLRYLLAMAFPLFTPRSNYPPLLYYMISVANRHPQCTKTLVSLGEHQSSASFPLP